jgi:carbonic anhydrase/acetyltransferase-like protein (isoleucine patch superfamily)
LKYRLDERRVACRGEQFIAHNATLIGSVVLENEASIWFNVVIRADNDVITVGEGSNVQDGSVLHTDAGIPLTVGRNCTIGHMVMLHGCSVGDGTLVGIKSVVMNRVRIGRNCLIGANSLITEGKEIPDRSLVLGAPAKIVRQLTDEEVQTLLFTAQHYVENARRYRRAMQQES